MEKRIKKSRRVGKHAVRLPTIGLQHVLKNMLNPAKSVLTAKL